MSLASLLLAGVIASAPAVNPPSTPATPAPGTGTASVEQCVPAVTQSARSVTFAAQMTALEGTQRMAMNISLQERSPTDAVFHTVLAPGLGVWRQSETGVKIYKYVKQVTNLAAPAVFRAQVRFRWLDAQGRVVRHVQRVTETCVEPVDLRPAPAKLPGA